VSTWPPGSLPSLTRLMMRARLMAAYCSKGLRGGVGGMKGGGVRGSGTGACSAVCWSRLCVGRNRCDDRVSEVVTLLQLQLECCDAVGVCAMIRVWRWHGAQRAGGITRLLCGHCDGGSSVAPVMLSCTWLLL
jgi:hypothetical protein